MSSKSYGKRKLIRCFAPAMLPDMEMMADVASPQFKSIAPPVWPANGIMRCAANEIMMISTALQNRFSTMQNEVFGRVLK